jgi:phosphoglycerol transferase MdoB-like AlkP superfamily enzyme
LLVVYGDHLGLPIYSLDRADEKLMQEIYGREYTSADMINIPLIVTAPGITPAAQLEQIGGQVDILPTIAGLTGASLQNQLYFGQDLLREGNNLLPERYYLPSGSVLNDASLFVPETGYGDGTHYSLADAGRQDFVSADLDQGMNPNSLKDEPAVPASVMPTKEKEKSTSSEYITKEQYERALDLLHLSNSYLSQLPNRNAVK